MKRKVSQQQQLIVFLSFLSNCIPYLFLPTLPYSPPLPLSPWYCTAYWKTYTSHSTPSSDHPSNRTSPDDIDLPWENSARALERHLVLQRLYLIRFPPHRGSCQYLISTPNACVWGGWSGGYRKEKGEKKRKTNLYNFHQVHRLYFLWHQRRFPNHPITFCFSKSNINASSPLFPRRKTVGHNQNFYWPWSQHR